MKKQNEFKTKDDTKLQIHLHTRQIQERNTSVPIIRVGKYKYYDTREVYQSSRAIIIEYRTGIQHRCILLVIRK